MSCGEHPQDCIGDHWCPVLHGRATGPRQWSAECPACGQRKLSISLGERARVIYTCHRGCAPEEIRIALGKTMIPPQCLPRTRPGRPRKAERSAEIKRLIDFVSTSPDLPAAALRLGLLLELGIPAAEARKLLGFSKTTYYRALKDIPTHR